MVILDDTPDGGGPLTSPMTSTTYDALGRKASETNQMGQTRTFSYDADGRLASVALPAVPDPLNAGASTHPTYQYGYDAFGHQTLIRDPYGRQTRFTFDERGNQLSRTLPLGVETTSNPNDFMETFSYDDLDRQTLHVSFEGTVTQSVYDVKTGRLSEKLFFDNLTDYNNGAGTPSQTWTYKYDAFDRVVSVTQSGGTNVGTTTTTYDAQGRVLSIGSPQGVINYEYDAATGLKKRTYATDPNNPLTVLDDTHYSYDVMGRLQTVMLEMQNGTAVSPAQTTTDKYDLLGNLREQDDPNGGIVDYLYNDLDQLTQEVDYAPDGTTKLAEYDYTLEADGKRTAATETIWWNVGGANTSHVNNLTWTYDHDGRLIDEALASYDPALSYTDAFTLDLVGNQRSETKNWSNKPHETTASTFDDNDRLLGSTDTPTGGAATTTTYGYGTGNSETQETSETVVTGGVTTRSETIGYDLEGRLSVVTVKTFNSSTGALASNQQTTYGYDSSGARVSSLLQTDTNLDGAYDTSVLTQFLNDPQNPTGYSQVLRQTTTDQKTGQIQQVVVYTIGASLVSQTTTPYASGVAGAPQTLVFGYDGHGSVRVLLDMTAAIATVAGIQQLFHYDAYGNLLNVAPSQAATAILYSGQMLDPNTGLYDNRARWYDPQTGRFNSLDPFFADLLDPQSLHKYLYAQGDPVDGIDPTGLAVNFFATLGTAIHHEIYKLYAIDHPGHLVTYGLEIPGSLGKVLPDIMDYTPGPTGQGEIGEIKPFSIYGVVSGEIQESAYVAIANGIETQYNGWDIGIDRTLHEPPNEMSGWTRSTWQPGYRVVWPGLVNPLYVDYVAVTLGNIDGIIYYHRVRRPNSALVGVAAAYAVEQYAIQIGRQLAGDLMSGIRGGLDYTDELLLQYKIEAVVSLGIAVGAWMVGNQVVSADRDARLGLASPGWSFWSLFARQGASSAAKGVAFAFG